MAEFVEYIGFRREDSTLVERFRRDASETKIDIITRVLASLLPSEDAREVEFIDVGQGAKVRVGERVLLFLPGSVKRAADPDAVAEARRDGLYMEGTKIEATRGSQLHAAMRVVQGRKGHRNEKGEIVQLSAFRQWHVVREGKLVPVLELKDPALAHRRGRTLATSTHLSAEDLDL